MSALQRFQNMITNILNNQEQTSNNFSPFEDVVCTINDDEINKLEILTINDELKNEITQDCSICLGEYFIDDEVIKIKCNHIYHKDCIIKYLKEYGYKCPVCRSEIGEPKYNI